jgi:hypothetical protein
MWYLFAIDHECECPFCLAKVQIILSESLIVGDAAQIDYTRIHTVQSSSPKNYQSSLGDSSQHHLLISEEQDEFQAV